MFADEIPRGRAHGRRVQRASCFPDERGEHGVEFSVAGGEAVGVCLSKVVVAGVEAVGGDFSGLDGDVVGKPAIEFVSEPIWGAVGRGRGSKGGVLVERVDAGVGPGASIDLEFRGMKD